MCIKLVLEGKTGKEIAESSISEFLEKSSANKFIRCRKKHLWAIEQRRSSKSTFVENTVSNSVKSPDSQSFWEVIDSLVLLAYASLAASKTLLQQLLACLNFTLESEDLSFWYKQKSDFYGLWSTSS